MLAERLTPIARPSSAASIAAAHPHRNRASALEAAYEDPVTCRTMHHTTIAVRCGSLRCHDLTNVRNRKRGEKSGNGTAMPSELIQPEPVPGLLLAEERHFSPSEVAENWGLSVEMIRRLFQVEPGVLVFQGPARKGKRPYKTIRIPRSVLDRVHARLQR